jgi:3-dehydroquinate synthase
MFKQSKILFGGLRSLDRELKNSSWQNAHYTILLDENTFQHCLPMLISSIDALQKAEFIEVPTGENCKCLEVAAQVWQTLLDGGNGRNDVIINLGGGTVCDLGGFVAATYKRGIRYINIPTTLLAMTDAAIGGKTAVDFGGVKNSIGYFYPATMTVIEHMFLDTLPSNEMQNGIMEMVKTAAVSDPCLYQQLISLPDTSHLNHNNITAITKIKAKITKADPYDHSIRKILNFGHTFGHAIEIHSQLPHGLSVGIGMQVAMYLSVKKLRMSEEIYLSYSKWLKSQTKIPKYTLKDIEAMLPLIHQDKKNTGENIHCVLLSEPGAAVIDINVSDNEIRDAMLKLGR